MGSSRCSLTRIGAGLGVVLGAFAVSAGIYHGALFLRSVTFDARYAQAADVQAHVTSHDRDMAQFRTDVGDLKRLMLRDHQTNLINVKTRLESLGRSRTPDEQVLYTRTLIQLQEVTTKLEKGTGIDGGD